MSALLPRGYTAGGAVGTATQSDCSMPHVLCSIDCKKHMARKQEIMKLLFHLMFVRGERFQGMSSGKTVIMSHVKGLNHSTEFNCLTLSSSSAM